MSGFLSSILETQRSQFFLWCPVFLGAGAASYFALRFEPSLSPALVLAVFGVFLALLWFVRLVWLRVLAWVGILLMLGLVLASWRSHMVAAPVLTEPFFGTVEGRVVHLDRSQSNRLRVTLDRVILYGIERADTPERVRITLPSKAAAARTGTRVMIYARVDGPGPPVEPGGFDFRKWAWFKQLGAVGYALGPLMSSFETPERSIFVTITNVRHWLAEIIRAEISGRNGAFAAAILTGERSAIDPALLENLRASNLAHLLAISGLHMGLLTGFIFGLVRYGIAAVPGLALRVNAKKIGALCAIPAGLAYLIVSGASVATQRAYVMAFVVLIAVVLDRPAFTLRAVALAALVILVVSPESVVEVGFQMSFAATIGLVAGFEALRHTKFWKSPVRGWRKFAKGVFSVGFSSFVAGAATAPFAAFHFNQIAQYGLLANLVAVPLMGLVVMPALIVALLLLPLGLSMPVFLVAGAGIGGILEIARIVAEMHGSVVKVPSGMWLFLPVFTIGCLILVLWKGWFRFAGLPVAVLGLAIWIGSERPTVLIDETGALVGVMGEEGRVLNKPKGQSFAASSWLENDGDIANQKQAYAREGLRNEGEVQIGMADFTVALSREESLNIRRLCEDFDVIVLPKHSGASAGDCLVIDADVLGAQGAISLHKVRGEIVMRGARGYSGKRLWSQ